MTEICWSVCRIDSFINLVLFLILLCNVFALPLLTVNKVCYSCTELCAKMRDERESDVNKVNHVDQKLTQSEESYS